MKAFMVGGAVRDILLHRSPKDVDWVVIGETPESMVTAGFKQVGADFPVFLHPTSGEEYALARTEKKTGNGYHGFAVETEGVSLKEDLKRRDLTINAMALGPEGTVDYFGGEKDLKNGILRHIDAEGFKEDPVRVLRIGRFLARWPTFEVASETMKLCKEIVETGEMAHLTPERVSAEMIKALKEERPSRFFWFLRMCGALAVVFPEIDALVGQTQPFQHHPEGDSFIHTMMVLDESCAGSEIMSRFAALVHDLGKGETPAEQLPKHHGHEMSGFFIVKRFCDRLKMSGDYKAYGSMVAKYHTHIHNFRQLKAVTIVDMADDLKMKSNIRMWCILPRVSACDHRGRTSFYADRPYPNEEIASVILHKLMECKMTDFFTIQEIEKMPVHTRAEKYRRARGTMVQQMRKEFYHESD
jgi:tRNA nucleotidyltransferase (CCA-adding enzyme)